MKYFCLLCFSLVSTFGYSTVYSTCATSGEYTTINPVNAVCTALPYTSWNNVSDTLIVKSGTTLLIDNTSASSAFEVKGFLYIEPGALVQFSGGTNFNPENEFDVLKLMVVDGTFDIISKNTVLTIDAAGLLVVNSTGVLTNTGTGNGDVVIEGNITGSGTIDFKGTSSGNGTVNGDPAPWPAPPWDLSTFGIIWDGTSWTPSTGPTNIYDRAIFNGDYSSSADAVVPRKWPSDGITINVHPQKATNGSYYTVTFDDDDDLQNLVSITNDGEIVLVDNSVASSLVIDVNADGLVTVKRNFTKAGWHHLSFPLKLLSLSKLGDVVPSGFTLNYGTPTSAYANVFRWDASTSSWVLATANDKIAGNAFNIYTPNTTSSVSLSFIEIFFNNQSVRLPYTYHDPGATPPGFGSSWTTATTAGWNQWYNPVQSYIISDNLELPVDFQNAIYIWDPGTQQYQTFSPTINGGTGIGNAEYVSPHQGIFVNNTTNTSGDFLFPTGSPVRTTSPAVVISYFKQTSQVMLLSATSNYTDSTNTWIAENSSATSMFDIKTDAYFRTPGSTVPIFNSVTSDSVACSINAFDDLEAQEIYLTFYHEDTHNKSFKISLDKDKSIGISKAILEDTYLNIYTDLTVQDYNFLNDTSAVAQRFKVVVHKSAIGISEENIDVGIKVWLSEEELNWSTLGDVRIKEVKVYSANGQLIASGDEERRIKLERSGIYVILFNTIDNKSYRIKLVNP